MPPLRFERTLALVAACMVLAACGRADRREAEAAAAPVRQLVDRLAAHPKWRGPPGRCLCVGLFQEEGVGDFPDGILDDAFARHPWLRRWSDCAPVYGRKQGLPGCRAGMTDYVCGVARRPDLAPGTARVMCHVNGRNELLVDEYDVVRAGDGSLTVKAVSAKATMKLRE